MKKLLFIACCTTMFFACSKDDNKPATKTNAELLIGTWHQVRLVGIDRNADFSFKDTATDISFEKDDPEYKFNFKADGTVEAWSDDADKIITAYYEVVGDSVKTGETKGVWSFTEKIEKLTADQMVTSDTGVAYPNDIFYSYFER